MLQEGDSTIKYIKSVLRWIGQRLCFCTRSVQKSSNGGIIYPHVPITHLQQLVTLADLVLSMPLSIYIPPPNYFKADHRHIISLINI